MMRFISEPHGCYFLLPADPDGINFFPTVVVSLYRVDHCRFPSAFGWVVKLPVGSLREGEERLYAIIARTPPNGRNSLEMNNRAMWGAHRRLCRRA